MLSLNISPGRETNENLSGLYFLSDYASLFGPDTYILRTPTKGYPGFESRSGRDNFQTISTPSSYSTCSGLSIKWTGRRLVTDSGTKCAWVIHESKAVQIHVHHRNRRCLHVPRVPGSVKNPHNNKNAVSHGIWRRRFKRATPVGNSINWYDDLYHCSQGSDPIAAHIIKIISTCLSC